MTCCGPLEVLTVRHFAMNHSAPCDTLSPHLTASVGTPIRSRRGRKLLHPTHHPNIPTTIFTLRLSRPPFFSSPCSTTAWLGCSGSPQLLKGANKQRHSRKDYGIDTFTFVYLKSNSRHRILRAGICRLLLRKPMQRKRSWSH